MPWFPVDDTFHSHPKRLSTSAAALGLWVVAGSWSQAHLTDGHIPDHVLVTLFPDPPEVVQGWAQELVATGLWRRSKRRGYVFNDWLYWGNKRSADEVRKLRSDRAEAGRKGGLASGKTRSKREASASSKPEATTSGEGEANAKQVLEPQAPPNQLKVSVVTDPVRGRPARPQNPSYDRQKINPERGERPYDRPLADALEAAGISPNGRPARGDTVAELAAQIRASINRAAEEPK